MNASIEVTSFRNILRRMERVVLSRIKDASYCSGLTVNQGHILLCLDNDDNHTITKLNDELRLDKASLSRTVESLVKKGLVSRESCETDRRSQKLGLTEEGKDYVKRINAASLESFSRIYASMDEEIKARITGDLISLVEAMRTEEGRKKSCNDNKQECC